MNILHTVAHYANAAIGIVLILVWFSVQSCSAALLAIKKDLECLHNDFNVVHHAHERDAWELEQRVNTSLAEHLHHEEEG